MVILQMYFDYNGGFGDKMYEESKGLAESITKEQGFLWKIWTEKADKGIAGGIYAFDTQENAEKYMDMHLKRLTDMGVGSNVQYEILDVNEKLSAITNFDQFESNARSK